MAPTPAPWAVAGDVLWCLGLGCLLAALRDGVRLLFGEGAVRCFFRDIVFFAAASVLVCGFAAGVSAGGLARWYMSAAALAGALCWHWAVQPAVHAAAKCAANALLWPLHAVHRRLVRPVQNRLAARRKAHKPHRAAKKSKKTPNSAGKQLQKASTILYN